MSRQLRILPLLTVLLLVNASQAGDAKTYRWVDAKGRVHYSDVPAPAAEQVQVKPGSGVVPAPSSKSEEGGDAPQDGAKSCERAKDRLATYQAAGSITETDALGKSRTYSAAEREQLLAHSRDEVARSCADQPQ